MNDSKMHCVACGRPVSFSNSLTDYHTAAAVCSADGRLGNAETVPCDHCDGTGTAFERVPGYSEPVTVVCGACGGDGASYRYYDDTRRVCGTCSNTAFDIKFCHRLTGRACGVPAYRTVTP